MRFVVLDPKGGTHDFPTHSIRANRDQDGKAAAVLPPNGGLSPDGWRVFFAQRSSIGEKGSTYTPTGQLIDADIDHEVPALAVHPGDMPYGPRANALDVSAGGYFLQGPVAFSSDSRVLAWRVGTLPLRPTTCDQRQGPRGVNARGGPVVCLNQSGRGGT